MRRRRDEEAERCGSLAELEALGWQRGYACWRQWAWHYWQGRLYKLEQAQMRPARRKNLRGNRWALNPK